MGKSSSRRGRGRPPIPPAEIPESLLARYKAGQLGCNALACLMGASPEAVKKTLVALGLYRGRSKAMRAHYAAKHGQRREHVRRLRQQGLSLAEIGRLEGVSRQRIAQLLDLPEA